MKLRKLNRILCRVLAIALLLTLTGFLPGRAAHAAETEYIVKYRASARRGAAQLRSAASDAGRVEVVGEEEMQRLERAGLLEWYEPDGWAVLLDGAAGSSHFEESQWNLAMIGAEAAFEKGFLGQGIRVAVVDSGVNPHADLADCLLPGQSYVTNAADPNDTADNYGHGTMVAGLISGAGTGGYIGAAPGAKIVPLKVTDGQDVRISSIYYAVKDAIDVYQCNVVNLSLGTEVAYQALKDAVDYAEAHNVVVVSSAGNSGNDTLNYPAAYDTVIGVGGVNRDGVVHVNSNRNESVLLTAPGASVRSTCSTGGYNLNTGTSFSAPQATAAAAVLLGIDGTLTPGELRTLLALTATDRGAAGYDTSYGYGILNITAAVHALTEAPEEGSPCSFLSDGGSATALRNNTYRTIACTYLLAEYDADGRFLRAGTRQLTLSARAVASLEPPAGEGCFTQLVFDPGTMLPLAPSVRTPQPTDDEPGDSSG